MLTIHAVDEAIWHFIGVFHLAEERGRMRIDYDRFKPVKTDPDPGAIQPLDQGAAHPYDPLDHLPEIPYIPPVPAMGPLLAEAAASYGGPDLWVAMPGRGDDGIGPVHPPAIPASSASPGLPHPPHIVPEAPPVPVWIVPPPGSNVVIAVQHARLADDDRIDAGDMQGGTVAPDQIMARMEALVAQAADHGVALSVALPADEMAFRLIAQEFQNAEAPANPAIGPTNGPANGPAADAHIGVLTGDDVAGLYQDGQAIAARPDLDALLPRYQRAEAAEAARIAREAAADDAEDTAQDGPGHESGHVATEPDAGGLGHDLIHGANTLVNQAAIVSAAIAAPVVAVAAGVYSYNIISQTNIWSDIDSLTGIAGGAADAATQGLNLASYTSFSNPIPDSAGPGDAPQYWATVTLEGSLISCNWIEQFNLMSDNDVTAITLQADQSLFLMGGNGALNQISLSELGSSYDLIIVGGQMINLNAILQTNVLLDDDRIMVGGGGQGAQISSGDNLLVNDAAITRIGHDNITQTTAQIDAMLADAAEGRVSLPQSVLDDPAFRDLAVVRVLQIEGDLVSLNFLRQTNILGDADQIELYRDGLTAAGGAVEVVAGSNMLVNAASITEFGVDADIYSGGGIYSDALLYQAELVSTDDPLMPDPGSGLASEAVLFLAEGMLGDDGEDVEFRPIGTDHAISADAMETVLT